MTERLVVPHNVSEVEKLYASGPMTGYPKYNYDAFEEATDQLRGVGYDVFSPHEVKGGDDWSWADYMRADIPGGLGAQGIAVLEGWQESRGATAEVNLGHMLGIYVLHKGLWLSQRLAESCD